MRGSAIALAVMVLGASGAMAQSEMVAAGSLSLAGVQANSTSLRDADYRLTHNVELRVESMGPFARLGRPALLDPYGARRRLASSLDYYPMGESGLHFSFGMRVRPRQGRSINQSAINPELRSRLDAPSLSTGLRPRDAYRRQSPMALVGWSQELGEKTSLRFDTGMMAALRKGNGLSALAIAEQNMERHNGMRFGPTAQVSFVHKF